MRHRPFDFTATFYFLRVQAQKIFFLEFDIFYIFSGDYEEPEERNPAAAAAAVKDALSGGGVDKVSYWVSRIFQKYKKYET